MDTQQAYCIYLFPPWLKLGKSLQTRCVNVFLLKLAFWARKIRILESTFFAKQELITCARLHVQDFVTSEIPLLISISSWEDSRLRLEFTQLSRILPTPLVCLYQAMETLKTFSIA